MSEQITVVEAIRRTLDEELSADPDVILIGQDIGAYGGAFGATAGLLDKHGPGRVREAPISEGGMMGVAVGAALMGLRPVVEFMFMDFMTLAMDQLVNHAAKLRYMYGGQARVPLVVRAPFGAGRGYGASHSQSLESWLVHVPGLKVVAPSNPSDASRLLRAAIRDDNPVVFLEHKLVYGVKGTVIEHAPERQIAGGSVVVRPGNDVTLIGYGQAAVMLQKAADELSARGVSAEVVDVPVLKPLSLDVAVASIHKTRRAVIVEEAPELCSVGSEIAQQLYRACFGSLLAPVAKLSGKDTPIASAIGIERAYLPQVDDVVRAVEILVASSRVTV